MTRTDLTHSQKEMLRQLPDHFSPERIDRIWLFPPHLGKMKESGVLVLSLIPDFSGHATLERRTVVTIRYETNQLNGGPRREEWISVEGSAPPERIERVITGVLARSSSDSREPTVEEIEGNTVRWEALMERFNP